MAIIPQIFPEQPEAAIASYSYTDIAEGTGYVVFYPFESQNGSIIYGMTTTSSLISNTVNTSKSTTTSTTNEVNYDLLFNMPKRISGKVFLVISVGTNDRAGVESSTYCTAKLYHYNGSETQLGSTVTTDTATSTGDAGQTLTNNLYFDLSGQIYHFKKGEILRLEIIDYIVGSAGSPAPVGGHGHDPANRVDLTGLIIKSGYNSQMQLHIPFRIDL